MKNWKNILIASLVLVVLFFIWRSISRTGYYLPKDHNPNVFGPKYWFALHDIVDRIPCPSCREEAIPLMSFVHDFVNQKLKKPLYNPTNFYKHVSEISKLNK